MERVCSMRRLIYSWRLGGSGGGGGWWRWRARFFGVPGNPFRRSQRLPAVFGEIRDELHRAIFESCCIDPNESHGIRMCAGGVDRTAGEAIGRAYDAVMRSDFAMRVACQQQVRMMSQHVKHIRASIPRICFGIVPPVWRMMDEGDDGLLGFASFDNQFF